MGMLAVLCTAEFLVFTASHFAMVSGSNVLNLPLTNFSTVISCSL